MCRDTEPQGQELSSKAVAGKPLHLTLSYMQYCNRLSVNRYHILSAHSWYSWLTGHACVGSQVRRRVVLQICCVKVLNRVSQLCVTSFALSMTMPCIAMVLDLGNAAITAAFPAWSNLASVSAA